VVTATAHALPFVVAGASLAAACHAAGLSSSGDERAASVAGVVVQGAADASLPLAGEGSAASQAVQPRPQVQLTWRLFETRRWLDGKGQEHQSSIFELLVEGGAPSHVQLGRRESFGCVVRDTTASASLLAGLDCYAHAHGEHANVERPRPGELRVEAFGQDEAYPDYARPRTNVQAAIIRVPADSDIVVDEELATVPADAPPRGADRTSP
jgi:hypothetical protein